MNFRVLSMEICTGNPRYFNIAHFPNLDTAINDANQMNILSGNVGRYFVVSEEEYQSYWKGVVS